MNVFVNELHYDNDGADIGEFIEVAGPAGTDLTGWSIALYNGSNGAVYDTLALSGVLGDIGAGFGFSVVELPANGLQNGAPDGLALVDDAGAVTEFLSYEGPIIAVDGPANGMTSSDIGVAESGDEPAGLSLQRVGTGSQAADFTFAAPIAETPGAANTDQVFAAPAGGFDLQITEIFPGNEPGGNLTGDWFEVTNLGGAAWIIADGGLLFDDESADPVDAVALNGVTEIAAGESVVFVEDDSADEFRSVWGPVIELGQVGTHDGSGLSQGGDAATLFLDADGDGVTAADQIDFEVFPDAEASGGQTYDVAAQAFSVDGGAGDGVVTTAAVNDAGQSAVGSPTDGAEIELVAPESDFTLELLHFTDQEAATAAIVDAPNLSAVLNALRAQDLGDDGIADNTLTLSSGDAYIPGVFFDASEAALGSAGIADIQIQNELGVQAIAFGNHEFDFGTGLVADLISGEATGGFTADAFIGTDLEGLDFTGADFPYLSANLDVTTDENLAPLDVAGGGAPAPNTVSSSIEIDVNGEAIGVVGATTPTLASISSPGGVTISPSPFDANPTPDQVAALAVEIQTEVDALLAANPDLNKVVLLSHMQQIGTEFQFAELLTDVDVIVAGGSNTRLFDDNDRIREGDSDQGQYPQFFTNAGGTTTAVVNTDGSYKYVGRLVIDFDADGDVIADSYDPEISGAYATDAESVAALGAEGLIDPEVQAIADAIETEIIATESNIFGVSDVFLNGNRSGVQDDAEDTDGVRTQESNLGNLTADANLAAARAENETVVLSIKNGGGIRASIGQTIVPAGGSEGVRTANEELIDASGGVIKPAGGISQNDVATTLAFNNDLVILTLTAEEIVGLLEHGVSALPGVAGQFPQISGVNLSFDPDLPAGDRLVNAGIFDEDGALIAPLVEDGAVVDPSAEFRITTLGFLAEPRFDESGAFLGGGDGYPFPNISDPEVAARVNLVALAEDGARTGDAVFADDGTEQDALAECLDDEFADEVNAFAMEDTGRDLDARIQNLDFRADAVFGAAPVTPTIQISEILYNPSSAEDDWEWVEIQNFGDEAVDLSGWVLDDANSVFHDAATIASGVVEAGETAVLYNADDLSADAFAEAWGARLNLVALTDWGANALNNGGDTVALWSSFADYDGDQATFANAVDRVDYDDSGDWPADDGAASIYLTDLSADNNDGTNWALSAAGEATPTGASPQPPAAIAVKTSARRAAIRMSRPSRRSRPRPSPSRCARRSARPARKSSPSTPRPIGPSSPRPAGFRCLMSPTSTISRSSPRSTPPISASTPPPSHRSISPTGSWRRPGPIRSIFRGAARSRAAARFFSTRRRRLPSSASPRWARSRIC